MLSPSSSASLQVRGGVRTSACAHRGLFYYDTSVELWIILFFAKCDFFSLFISHHPVLATRQVSVGDSQIDAGPATTAGKHPVTEQSKVNPLAWIFWLFCNAKRRGRIVDVGCSGILQTAGGRTLRGSGQFQRCVLVAWGSTKTTDVKVVGARSGF